MEDPSVESGDQLHRVHNVLTIVVRAKIVKWMLQQVAEKGDKSICSKALIQFPDHFRGSASANKMRSMRLCRDRVGFIDDDGNVRLRRTTAAITRVSKEGLKTVCFKAKRW